MGRIACHELQLAPVDVPPTVRRIALGAGLASAKTKATRRVRLLVPTFPVPAHSRLVIRDGTVLAR